MTIHVVGTGDSLWNISRRYGVQIDEIVQENGLNSTLLMPGLALYIPTPALTIRFYQIKPRDTLWELAYRFQTTVEQILAVNGTLDLYNLQIGQTINIPTPQKMTMETLGFFVPYSLPGFFTTFPTYADQLTYLAVASYSFTGEGEVYVDLSDEGIAATCRKLNVVPLLMIRNIVEGGVFSPENVGSVLENPSYRKRLIDEIMNVIREKGYGGVSVDFEFIPPARRDDFIRFLRELKHALGRFLLHVNVHSKTEDSLTNPITGGHDYEAIGKVADIVAIMTMDFGYPGGPPNPVTPISWLEEVIRYGISLIDRDKLQVAFPLYGYDWALDTNEASGLSLLAAQNRAIEQRVSIEFDLTEMTPFYRYWTDGNGHIVWFDDIRSYNEKYKLVDFYRLLGVTFWETRLSFPQNWAYMKQHINVKKR